MSSRHWEALCESTLNRTEVKQETFRKLHDWNHKEMDFVKQHLKSQSQNRWQWGPTDQRELDENHKYTN